MKRALAAAAASLFAAGAIAAEEEADFAASKGSALEAQLHERLKAGIRTIPGTDTQYLIGGYLQLDGIATRKKQDGDEQNTFIVSTMPFGPARRRLPAERAAVDASSGSRARRPRSATCGPGSRRTSSRSTARPRRS